MASTMGLHSFHPSRLLTWHLDAAVEQQGTMSCTIFTKDTTVYTARLPFSVFAAEEGDTMPCVTYTTITLCASTILQRYNHQVAFLFVSSSLFVCFFGHSDHREENAARTSYLHISSRIMHCSGSTSASMVTRGHAVYLLCYVCTGAIRLCCSC